MNTAIITFLAIATFYSDAHHGKLTASGEPFDMTAYSCATSLTYDNN